MPKRLEKVENLENEVCSSKSLDMKRGVAEHIASMATCKVAPEIEVNTFDCAIVCSMGKKYRERPDYIQRFWAKATTETQVKLGGYDDPILAFVDHDSKINIMSQYIYVKDK